MHIPGGRIGCDLNEIGGFKNHTVVRATWRVGRKQGGISVQVNFGWCGAVIACQYGAGAPSSGDSLVLLPQR